MNIKSKVRTKCIPIKQRKVALDRAVDITLAEVGKVIDEWCVAIAIDKTTSSLVRNKDLEELKQTLGIK